MFEREVDDFLESFFYMLSGFLIPLKAIND
jgi:hypothetical protein